MISTPAERTVMPFPQRCSAIGQADLAALPADHAKFRGLCRQLEMPADRLADRPPHGERHAVADPIEAATRRHLEVTSGFLNQAFTGERGALGCGVLARMLLRQIGDAVHADDVAEALRSEPLEADRIEMLGYMSRCLFDGYRPALDTQEVALLLLGRQRLIPAARRLLERYQERAADLD